MKFFRCKSNPILLSDFLQNIHPVFLIIQSQKYFPIRIYQDLQNIGLGDFNFRHRTRRIYPNRFFLYKSRGQHKKSKQQHGHIAHRCHVDARTFPFYLYPRHSFFIYG